MSRSPRAGVARPAAIALLAAVVAVVGAAVTKPSREAHNEALRDHCQSSAGVIGAAGCEVALGAGQLFGAVTFQDRVLYSELRAGDKVLSRGVLGMVWVVE
jgi:hypothetical protein